MHLGILSLKFRVDCWLLALGRTEVEGGRGGAGVSYMNGAGGGGSPKEQKSN
jgi:hypothetical protein